MYKRGITEEDRVKLLNHARISMEENESINNLEFFGEKLIRTKVCNFYDNSNLIGNIL
jgi:hypothetical protein